MRPGNSPNKTSCSNVQYRLLYHTLILPTKGCGSLRTREADGKVVWSVIETAIKLQTFILCMPQIGAHTTGAWPLRTRQTNRYTDTDRQIDRQIDEQIHKQIDRQIDEQIHKQIGISHNGRRGNSTDVSQN